MFSKYKGEKLFQKGYHYRHGTNGYAKDSFNAFNCYNDGWKNGNYDALYELSEMYYYGEGVKKNIPMALSLLQQYVDECPNISESKLTISFDKLAYGYYYDTKEYDKFFSVVERKIKSRIEDRHNFETAISAIAYGIGTQKNIGKAIFMLNTLYEVYGDFWAKKTAEQLSSGKKVEEIISLPDPIDVWNIDENTIPVIPTPPNY